MHTTKLINLIDPEVMGPLVKDELKTAIRLAPIVSVDYTLAGKPGSTITLPKWGKIAEASDVAEGEDMGIAQLSAETDTATVKKIGQAITLTVESLESGLGDPLQAGAVKLANSLASKVNSDILTALSNTTNAKEYDEIDIAAIDDGLLSFTDNSDDPVILITNSLTASKLRAEVSANGMRASNYGDEIIKTGKFEYVLGAQIIRDNKVPADTVYLVKKGALALYMKKDLTLKTDEDILKGLQVIAASQHYVAHLYDENKTVKLTKKVV